MVVEHEVPFTKLLVPQVSETILKSVLFAKTGAEQPTAGPVPELVRVKTRLLELDPMSIEPKSFANGDQTSAGDTPVTEI